MEPLLEQGFDRAHIALHGRYGEDGTVQGALELMGIPIPGAALWRARLQWINGVQNCCGRQPESPLPIIS